MALKIRLQRGGAKHKPVYRMVVADARARRDGRFVEKIGTYAPQHKHQDQELRVDLERAAYWVSVGAQPTDTARTLLNRARREADPAAKKEVAPEMAEAADVVKDPTEPNPEVTQAGAADAVDQAAEPAAPEGEQAEEK